MQRLLRRVRTRGRILHTELVRTEVTECLLASNGVRLRLPPALAVEGGLSQRPLVLRPPRPQFRLLLLELRDLRLEVGDLVEHAAVARVAQPLRRCTLRLRLRCEDGGTLVELVAQVGEVHDLLAAVGVHLADDVGTRRLVGALHALDHLVELPDVLRVLAPLLRLLACVLTPLGDHRLLHGLNELLHMRGESDGRGGGEGGGRGGAACVHLASAHLASALLLVHAAAVALELLRAMPLLRLELPLQLADALRERLGECCAHLQPLRQHKFLEVLLMVVAAEDERFLGRRPRVPNGTG